MNLLNKKYVSVSVVIAFVVIFYSQLSAQKNNIFHYKEPSSSIIAAYYDNKWEMKIPENSYFSEKDFKNVNDANENTIIIQSSLNNNQIVVLPNSPLVISQRGLTLNSNNILIFQINSELIIESNSLEYYQLLKVHDVENVKILNARLTGDRNSHIGSAGEFGYGISIRNSSNVLVENFHIENFWGDGIAIGYGTTKTNKNIVLRKGYLDNNRRNGLSVMNVNGLNIENLLVANTNGTNPMFGIDFEPNNKADNMASIFMNNIYSYNNANGGLMLTFSNLKTSQQKSIGFTLNNFTDSGSPNGLVLAGVPKEATGLEGIIKLNNIVLENNMRPITGRIITNNKVFINIENLSIIRPMNKNINKREVTRVFNLKRNYSLKFKD